MDVLKFMKHRADLQSLMLSVGTVFAGTAAAVIRGNMEVLSASVCLLFAVILQLGCNLYHYYMFMTRITAAQTDAKRIPTATLQAGDQGLRVLREGSTACLLLSLTLGVTLMTMAAEAWWTLVVGGVLYLLVFIMARYRGIYRSPVALVVTFIVFGPLGVISTTFLQGQHEATGSIWNLFDAAPSLFLGPAMGFLACSHHIVMSYFNTSIDPDPERPGVIKFFGKTGAQVMVALNGLFALVTLVWMVSVLYFPQPLIAIIPGFIAFCLNTYIAVRLHRSPIGELRFLSTMTRINFLLTGVLTFVIWWIIGSPDDSLKVFFPMQ